MFALVIVEVRIAGIRHERFFPKEVSCQIDNGVLDLVAHLRSHFTRIIGGEKLVEHEEKALVVGIDLRHLRLKIV